MTLPFNFKPMLAATLTAQDIYELDYPIAGSGKIDGIRCLIHPTKGPVTRTLKPIPNNWVREYLTEIAPVGLDGELVKIDYITHANNSLAHLLESGVMCSFNDTQSAMMSREGMPMFRFLVFDSFMMEGIHFFDRQSKITEMLLEHDSDGVLGELDGHLVHHRHKILKSPEEVFEYQVQMLGAGYEGIILRKLTGLYKHGRSTQREQGMLKFKEFADAEAVVIGVEELMHNDNEAEQDAFGYTKRSSHIVNLRPSGKLGALKVMDRETGGIFSIGTGFNDSQRVLLWETWEQLMGRIVTYKYQPFGGKTEGIPRFPVFIRFREQE
jgi:DNA ligase-1